MAPWAQVLPAGMILMSALLPVVRPGGGGPGGKGPQGKGNAEQAAAFFAKNCARCHSIPDERYATDRAWLKRIADTA